MMIRIIIPYRNGEGKKPDVGNTVIDDDNNYGMSCDRSGDADPPPIPTESPLYNIVLL